MRNKKVLAILSLLISIAMWTYVMGTVDPETTKMVTGIKVNSSGDDYLKKYNLEAELTGPEVIDIKIKGKRSAVNKAVKGGITATVDVSHCEYGENEAEIRVVMPSGVRGVSILKMSDDTETFVVK